MRATLTAVLAVLSIGACTATLPRAPLGVTHPANPAAAQSPAPPPSTALTMSAEPGTAPPPAAAHHHDHHGEAP